MNERIEQTLGRNIRAERRRLGLTKIDFCLQAGISRVLLDLIEENRSNLKLSTLEQIAHALGKEPWELLK